MHQTVFRRALLGATALACIALAMPAHAQENSDDSDQNTDGIVVTSTKIPTQIEKTGSSISVVTKEEMEEQQTRQVLDVLTTTPGISVSQFGAKGTDSNVRMRGLPGQYTSVLIDGVEVSDPSRSQTAFDFS
jgi:vitamin B12 transporter